MKRLLQQTVVAIAFCSAFSFARADEPTDKLDLRLEFGQFYRTNQDSTFVQEKQKALWATALYRVSPAVKIGVEAGHLFRRKESQFEDDGFFQASETSKISSFYMGPVAQFETNRDAFTFYVRGGAGILNTAVRSRSSVAFGGNTDIFDVKASFLSPAVSMAVGADYHINQRVSIGLGLRDLWVFEKGFSIESSSNGSGSQTQYRDTYKGRHELMPFIGMGFHF